jgi:hypothetical protein
MINKRDILHVSLEEIHCLIFVFIVFPVFLFGCIISALCELGWIRCVIMRWSIVAALILFVLADIVINTYNYAGQLEYEIRVRNYAKINMHLVCT